jgi:hypothetical protein
MFLLADAQSIRLRDKKTFLSEEITPLSPVGQSVVAERAFLQRRGKSATFIRCPNLLVLAA